MSERDWIILPALAMLGGAALWLLVDMLRRGERPLAPDIRHSCPIWDRVKRLAKTRAARVTATLVAALAVILLMMLQW